MTMTTIDGCEKYQRGDQWFCDRCNLVWDIDDHEPPDCLPIEKPDVTGERAFDQIKHNLGLFDND